MEHIEEFQTAREDLVSCQCCSWRAAERYECRCKESRIIKQTKLVSSMLISSTRKHMKAALNNLKSVLEAQT
jgi:hypothetical protein